MSQVAIFAPRAVAIDGEFAQFSRLKKGKAIDKAVNAVKQGADALALSASMSPAARKAVFLAVADASIENLAAGVAHGADYGRAWATVAGRANISTVGTVEDGAIKRAAWLELPRDLKKARIDANKSQVKDIDAALALWSDIQTRADAIRADK